MNISFYSAATAMISQQTGMNVYANNVANVNTVGYKSLRPSFADCLYTLQKPGQQDWETGHGVYPMKTDFLWEQGSFSATEQDLDFALPNDGFFMIEDRNGDTYLTRDGAFGMSLNADDGIWQLMNGAGEYVLDYDGNRIEIPFKTVTTVDENGEEITAQTNTPDFEAITDLIGVFTVPNNYGLLQAEDNHFAVTENSGQPVADRTLDKVRTALERSTVDLAAEMVHIIESQRAFQFGAKMIQTSDELMRIANSLRA
jgi:flagellar basal body rod protein FlgG